MKCHRSRKHSSEESVSEIIGGALFDSLSDVDVYTPKTYLNN